MRLPSSSSFPSPTARTLPFSGFSLAVSGRTMPLAVFCSSSIARTIRRSPRGLSFILENLHLEKCDRRLAIPVGGPSRPLALSSRECQITASIYRPLALSEGDCQRLGQINLKNRPVPDPHQRG